METRQESPEKLCPHCAERIQAAARKCRFCGEWLDEPSLSAAPRLPSTKAPERPSAVDGQGQTVAQTGSGAAPVTESTPSGLALASLVTGLLSLLLGAVVGIPAVIMGFIARRRANHSDEGNRLRRMATAGVALGSISLVLTAIAAVLFFGGSDGSPAEGEFLPGESGDIRVERAAAQGDCRSLQAFMQRLIAGDLSVVNQAEIDKLSENLFNYPEEVISDLAAGEALDAVYSVRDQMTQMYDDQGLPLDVNAWTSQFEDAYSRASVACQAQAIGVTLPQPS